MKKQENTKPSTEDINALGYFHNEFERMIVRMIKEIQKNMSINL